MFAVPDLTIPDAGASRRALPPATVVRALAADPGSWQHLVHYAPGGPSRVRLQIDHPDYELWLYGWLPGQSASLDPPEALFTVVFGAITELDTVRRRTVLAGQTRVLGPGRLQRLVNLEGWPAVTLHAVAR